MKNNVTVTVKRLSDTLWSARYDAVAVLHSKLEKVIRAVEELRDGQSENMETRSDAGCF